MITRRRLRRLWKTCACGETRIRRSRRPSRRTKRRVRLRCRSSRNLSPKTKHTRRSCRSCRSRWRRLVARPSLLPSLRPRCRPSNRTMMRRIGCARNSRLTTSNNARSWKTSRRRLKITRRRLSYLRLLWRKRSHCWGSHSSSWVRLHAKSSVDLRIYWIRLPRIENKRKLRPERTLGTSWSRRRDEVCLHLRNNSPNFRRSWSWRKRLRSKRKLTWRNWLLAVLLCQSQAKSNWTTWSLKLRQWILSSCRGRLQLLKSRRRLSRRIWRSTAEARVP